MNAETTSGQTDIAIVGGGLVGLSLALAMDLAGVRTVLVDRSPLSIWHDAAFDGRASAITASSRAMLEALGAWSHIAHHAQPMVDIVVTDSRLGEKARPTLLHFDTDAKDGEAAAFMMENRVLGERLAALVGESSTIRVVAPASAAVREHDGGHAIVDVDTGEEIRAGLVVAADGRGSKLREAAGIETVGWSYSQHGIVTTVEHEHAHGGVAEEHFLPAGPFAILPLTGNRASLVWTERDAVTKDIMALDDEGFEAELSRRFGTHLGDVQPVGPRWSYPLAMQLSKSYIAPRLALVGDAAHAVHPIAGLGLNLGLRDAAALTEVCVDAMRLGLDIGSTAVLERYEAWRRPDNVSVALATDGLNRLFSNDNPALRAVRDLGLGVVDRLPPLKDFFVSEAAGISGELPRLMRGEAI